MAEEKIAGLTEAQLGEVSGGGREGSGYSGSEKPINDSRGRKVGKMNEDGKIYYYACPKCQRPAYIEWGVYHCDPCNDWYWSCGEQRWWGSLQELISAVK